MQDTYQVLPLLKLHLEVVLQISKLNVKRKEVLALNKGANFVYREPEDEHHWSLIILQDLAISDVSDQIVTDMYN